MKRIYIARHGETDWNALGKLQGHTDIALNDAGRAQARELAARLSRAALTAVTTSDLSRAQETGAIVAEALSLGAPSTDADLRERAFGVFEGLTREECATRHPDAWRAWVEATQPPEGAEAVALAIARLGRALTRIIDGTPDEASTLVISHGGLMRLWLQETLGTTLPLIKNGAVFVVERTEAGFDAKRWE